MLQQIPENNNIAIDWLYDNYFSFLFEKVYRLVRNTQDAEDVIQEVFLSILEGKRIIKVEVSFEAYLKKMAINRALDFLRKKDILRYSDDPQNVILPATQRSDQPIEQQQLQQAVQEAINLLPPRCKEVFLLSRFEDKSYNDIASDLGISRNTVENQMTKALRMLRNMLKPFLSTVFILSQFFSDSA